MTTMIAWWRSAALCAGLVVTGSCFAADAYPDHKVRMIVPFSAGGPTDVIGRSVANESVIRRDFQGVTGEGGQFEASRQGVETREGAFGIGDRGRRHLYRRTVVRTQHEESIGPRIRRLGEVRQGREVIQ